MRTYPIMLDLHGRRAVVIGAGSVGLRKARPLVECGADVVLVTGGEPAELPGADVLAEPYRAEHVDGARLAFACTDDAALNARIAADARAAGAWVNVADTPELCDFYLPATARDGDVVVAVGTGGAAPGLAVHLRNRLAEALPADTRAFASALNELRGELRARGVPPRRRMSAIRELAGPDGLEIFRRGGAAELWVRLEKLLARDL